MRRALTIVLIGLLACTAHAHVGDYPSIHDTVAAIIERFQQTMPAEELKSISVEQVEQALTDEDRKILGTYHLTFHVNVPVTVYVCRQSVQDEVVFWLEGRGFEKTGEAVGTSEDPFNLWKKDFPAGDVGLGVNSLSGSGDHYFVAIQPQNTDDSVEITEIYPGQHTVGEVKPGERMYVSWDETVIEEVPETLKGAVLLRGNENARRSGRLTSVYNTTVDPATAEPDQIVLTWASDPKTTQAVQWRTSTEVKQGAVRYRRQETPGSEVAGPWITVAARQSVLEQYGTINDPVCHRYQVNLVGLEPGTTYEYEVGDGSPTGWTTPYTFTTAPDKVTPFKFIYMGDAQNGLDTWGKVVHNAHAAEPDAAFHIMAGDLVNRGNERWDWDHFFVNSAGIFENKQLVPAIGNHEDQGDKGPWMYLDIFNLPENGPDTITPERAYSFEYSNALFIVLDSCSYPSDQTEWLEAQLANSDATWKIAIYHHPAYSSGVSRDNPGIREFWTPIFDKYHVDLALQGHDHAYLRTYPMYDEKPVDSPEDGTIYIVSVSGTKMYDQGDFDYKEFGMTNVSTYQVLDLQIDGDKLTYKSYDLEGKLRDEFVIEK